MAQRQFRSDDTDKWQYGYGSGVDGALSQTTTTDAPTDSACTGTSGATSLSATNAGFTAGQIIVIDQTIGTNANASPSWELNKIASYSAGTITLAYPLTRDYTSGAQVVVVNQYITYNLNGATLTAKAWSGSVGGLIVRMANVSISGTGTINLSGLGFRGGAGYGGSVISGNGEGYPGASSQSRSANGNGGGGTGAGSGAGGGNGTTGYTGGGGETPAGGSVAGNAGLTIFSMGGGGAGGRDPSFSNGGAGGAKILLISKSVDTSSMTINLNGTIASAANGMGGSGAGGSALIKGQTIVLGTNKITALPGSTGNGNWNVGGGGGNGRIHADYLISLTGTTTPTLDSTQDNTLTDIGGGFLSFL